MDEPSEFLVLCVVCRVQTRHVALCEYVDKPDAAEFRENGYSWEDNYRIVQCRGCHSITFQRELFTEDDPDGPSESALYPPRIEGIQAPSLEEMRRLPYNVRTILNESLRAAAIDAPLLATVGLRALVEAICRDQNISGKDLKQKIDGLVSAGVMTKQGADLLHLHRDFGNAAAHETEEPTPEVLHMLFEILIQLVRTTYVVPALARRIVATSPPPRRTRATGQSGPQA